MATRGLVRSMATRGLVRSMATRGLVRSNGGSLAWSSSWNKKSGRKCPPLASASAQLLMLAKSPAFGAAPSFSFSFFFFLLLAAPSQLPAFALPCCCTNTMCALYASTCKHSPSSNIATCQQKLIATCDQRSNKLIATCAQRVSIS